MSMDIDATVPDYWNNINVLIENHKQPTKYGLLEAIGGSSDW